MLADLGFASLPPPCPHYCQYFTKEEIRELDATPLTSAVRGIAIARSLSAHVLAAVGGSRV